MMTRAVRSTGEYCTERTFAFLRDLKSHNDREWFLENKGRYEEDVKAPLLRFIADLGPRLREISPRFVADPRPVGGSMFRIYRDTRFSRDKKPYKTHAAAQFLHERSEKNVHAPGFYLHLEPGECYAGGGIWRPESGTLASVRARILQRPEAWRAVLATGISLEGESLVRPPRGVDPGHPFVEHLKMKDFYAGTALPDAVVRGGHMMDAVMSAFRNAAPLVEFVTRAMKWPW